MKTFDKTFEEKIADTIEAIEEETEVEVVVSISRRSDSYTDAYWKGGVITMTAMLLFCVYYPVTFSDLLLPLDLAAAFALGALAVRIFPWFKRLLISNKRLQRAVHRAADTYFLENDLTETIGRTSFLVYISLFEEKSRLVADKGITDTLPPARWRELEIPFHEIFSSGKPFPQAILDALDSVTPTFAEFLPAEDEPPQPVPIQARRRNDEIEVDDA